MSSHYKNQSRFQKKIGIQAKKNALRFSLINFQSPITKHAPKASLELGQPLKRKSIKFDPYGLRESIVIKIRRSLWEKFCIISYAWYGLMRKGKLPDKKDPPHI